MPKANKYAKAAKAYNPEEPTFKDKRFIFRIEQQLESPLFRLPLEIRTLIWGLALPRSVRPCLTPGSPGNEKRDSPLYLFDNTFPLCRWQKGNLCLLRACKRINTEATRTFFAGNVFDCLIEGPEPSLCIAYGDPDPEPVSFSVEGAGRRCSSRCARHPGWKLGVSRPSTARRKMSSVKREHLAVVRGWVLALPTHLGLDFEQQIDDVYDYMLHSYPGACRWPEDRVDAHVEAIAEALYTTFTADLKRYRQGVLFGLDRWLQLSGAVDNKRRFAHLELILYRYFSCLGKPHKPDVILQKSVIKALPRWVLGQIDDLD